MQIRNQPNHSYRVIPVAIELIKEPAHEIKELISDDGTKYIVHDFFVYEKKEGISNAMLLLAIGKNIDHSEIWNAYRKSDRIVFFVVEEKK